LSERIEKTVSSEFPFTGHLIRVRADEVILPNGRKTLREIVVHPGAVAVVAVADGKVLVERQYRHAAGKVLWEVPAGTLKIGESPKECAERELLEETGYEAESMEELAYFYVAPGYSTEVMHIFLATGLRKKGASLEEDETIEVKVIPIKEALDMVRSNEIEDAKTIIALLLAENRMKDL